MSSGKRLAMISGRSDPETGVIPSEDLDVHHVQGLEHLEQPAVVGLRLDLHLGQAHVEVIANGQLSLQVGALHGHELASEHGPHELLAQGLQEIGHALEEPEAVVEERVQDVAKGPVRPLFPLVESEHAKSRGQLPEVPAPVMGSLNAGFLRWS